MLKKFLKGLLYIAVALLVAFFILGVFYLLDWPVEAGLWTIVWVFGLFFAFLIIRKLYVRARARSQVRRLINKGEPADLKMDGSTSKELLEELRAGWKKALTGIRKSSLRLKGDPLYVLPWYMVIGKPRSGKSTALKNAKLLLPDIDLPKQSEGSTRTLDWWLYEEAIIIDTAGRYAVPEVEARDKKEWSVLLRRLARHKQKEPLNGLVLAISADRLLENSDDDLLEEGRRVRANIAELMEQLEAKVPVYVMVTKCDLIEGFTEWANHLPPESQLQAMGGLSDGNSEDVEKNIDHIFGELVERLKDLRLLMLERSQHNNEEVLRFPQRIEQLRRGLHVFVQTALKPNPYQDTPLFRGVFFSSSQQTASQGSTLINRGMFLHQFFSRVLPADRRLLDSLPSAQRLRRAVARYTLSVSGMATIVGLVLLSSLYTLDVRQLRDLAESYPTIESRQTDINDQISELLVLRSLIIDLQASQDSWILPWVAVSPRNIDVLASLKEQYVEAMKTMVLLPIDDHLARRAESFSAEQTGRIAGGLIRRINMIRLRLADDGLDASTQLLAAAPVGADFLQTVRSDVSREAGEAFHRLYASYLEWHRASSVLDEERASLQSAFVSITDKSRGGYEWIIQWVNGQIDASVKLDDFWGGSVVLDSAPEIASAFTQAGRALVDEFLIELVTANDNSRGAIAIKDLFEGFYKRSYATAWLQFAERFDEGRQQFRNRREWQTAIDALAFKDNPYFVFLERLSAELLPLEVPELFDGQEMYEFFVDMQVFSGAEGSGGPSRAQQKLALKILSKLGPVGKQLSQAGKTTAKEKRKLDKEKAKTGQETGPSLEDALEEGAKALVAYKAALTEIAFNVDSADLAYSATQANFKGDVAAAEGPVAAAEKAILDLQRVAGKPKPTTKLFWQLYRGSLDLYADYALRETDCYLQDAWVNDVLVEAEGVSQNELAQLLIGETGLVWNYVENVAGAFLKKKTKSGYVAEQWDDKRVAWTGDMMTFLDAANQGRRSVGNEYTVRIGTLPTGINIGATVSPYATFLDLHCADGVQSLANFNYSDRHDFKWSLGNCGDVTLRIEVGPIRLEREYPGVKGFSQFLSEFQSGRKVFTPEDFPEKASLLKSALVEMIDVNYEIRDEQAVENMLYSVPLSPPPTAVACWSRL